MVGIMAYISIFATILTVDNKIPSIGDYTTLQAAYAAASPGDTLYVYPSELAYNSVSIRKEIHIVGGGFDYNFETSGIPVTNVAVSFATGSAGSSITGVFIRDGFTISDDNIQISNCRVAGNIDIHGSNTQICKSRLGALIYREGVSGNVVKSCLIKGTDFINHVYATVLLYNGSQVAIHNCIVDPVSSRIIYVIYFTGNSSYLTLVNNVIAGNNLSSSHTDAFYPTSFGNNSVLAVNNIINRCNGSNNYFTYNITDNSNLSPSNIYNADIGSLFVDYLNGDFHLAPGSQAIGAGEGGVDCGAYGGIYPFDDTYNTPPLPTIIELTTPTTIVDPDEPLQVHIRATTEGN